MELSSSSLHCLYILIMYPQYISIFYILHTNTHMDTLWSKLYCCCSFSAFHSQERKLLYGINIQKNQAECKRNIFARTELINFYCLRVVFFISWGGESGFKRGSKGVREDKEYKENKKLKAINIHKIFKTWIWIYELCHCGGPKAK